MWGAAAGVALLLASSACSGGTDEDPTQPSFVPVPSTTEPEPSATSSAEPSADPTATAEALVAPELPAVATEETPEGAAAFAEWWFETLNYATATGDTEQLTASSDMEICDTCSNLVGRIEEAYSSGGGISGGEIAATVEAPSSVDGGIATFVVHLEVAPATQTISGVKSELPAGRSVNAAATAWRDGWVMGDLRRS